MDLRKLKAFLLQAGSIEDAELFIERKPFCSIHLYLKNYDSGEIIADTLYEAMQILHSQLDSNQIKLLCNCFRYDVKVSSMSNDMGSGVMGYQLTLGRVADKEVSIFDPTDDIDAVVTLEEQKNFFMKYLESLKSDK